jgi:2-polyprenyl-3-methyl-5-hydroxy-6-metoxy-1,4-benzoquinol methylase
MSWYKEWFDSDNYLKVYSHRDETEAERLVNQIVNNTNFVSGSKVLDMACGSGRHSIIFASKGYEVTAIDLSKNLIATAEANAKEQNVNIEFVNSDILEFNSNKKFDLTVNLFTSFGYFDDDEDNFKIIQKAFDLLTDGGMFVIDYFNKNYLLNNLIPTTVYSDNGTRITQNRFIKGNRVRKNITIENNGKIDEFYESVRLYNHDEMLSFLKRAGFKIIRKFGDYEGNDFEEDSSQRLIIFAQK